MLTAASPLSATSIFLLSARQREKEKKKNLFWFLFICSASKYLIFTQNDFVCDVRTRKTRNSHRNIKCSNSCRHVHHISMRRFIFLHLFFFSYRFHFSSVFIVGVVDQIGEQFNYWKATQIDERQNINKFVHVQIRNDGKKNAVRENIFNLRRSDSKMKRNNFFLSFVCFFILSISIPLSFGFSLCVWIIIVDEV